MSDRGSQYASDDYRRRLAKARSHRLHGPAAANPYDNAKAESFMKTLKVEAVYLMAYEASMTLQPTFPASSTRFTTPADSTPR